MAEEAPKDTERIVDSLSNLDTARMTVRWALERIRFLEQANSEMLELLRQARQAKDDTLKELEGAKQSADKRLTTIAQKERFVGEMQGMLNSLFKGEIDLKEVLEAKTKLEEHKLEAEAKAQARAQEAEARARKEGDDYQKRLAEMEANYARALGDSERRYQEQLQDLQRQRHEESLEGQGREARFKEKLLEDVQKQADQYHQKLSLMQFEYAAKRKELQKEFEDLKEKLFEEARSVEVRQADSFRMAREHWDAERKRLQDMLAQREQELQRQHESIREITDRVKREQAMALGQREDELRAVEAKLRQDLAHSQAALEAERRALEERMRQEAEELREREERRFEELNRHLEADRSRHREELASLQGSFDSRLALTVQEQLRVREEELTKRLDSTEKHETDFQSRLARATQELRERMSQVEARAEAELQAMRADGRRLLEEQASRHLRELEAARAPMREFERRIEEALTLERERHLKDLAAQSLKDRETLAGIEGGLRKEVAGLQAELDQARAALAREQQAALDTRTKLREAFERQLAGELDGLAAARKEAEARLAEREAHWQAEQKRWEAKLEREVAERSQRAEAALADRVRGLEAETKRLSDVRFQESQESAARVKLIQDRFDERLQAEVRARTELLLKQFEAEKAALEQRAKAELATVETRAHAEREAAQQRVQTQVAAVHAQLAALESRHQAERAAIEQRYQAELAEARSAGAAAGAAPATVAPAPMPVIQGPIPRTNEEKTLVLGAAKPVPAAVPETTRPPQNPAALVLPSMPEPAGLAAAPGAAKGRGRKWVLTGLAVVALAAAGAWLRRSPAPRPGAAHAIPSAHPTGLVWRGGTLWVSDWFDQAVYELEPGPGKFSTKKKYPLAGVMAVGLALSKDHLFVIDGATGQLQRRALDAGLSLQGTSASPGPKPSALFHDGRHLWSADKQTGLLYQHNDDPTLSVSATYKLGPDAAGLQAGVQEFWWAGSENRLFMRHSAAPALGLEASFELPELQAAGKPLSCFVWKDGKLWIGLEGEAKLLERSAEHLKKL